MPGRFTSDTNSRCLLVSRSTWTTTLVDTCYPVAVLTGTASVLGVASFSSSGGTFAAAAPRATDGVILNQTVASGIDNVLTFDVVDLQDADEEGVLVTVLETIDNVPYVIGGGRLRQGRDQRIDFRATGNNIQVVLNGPYTNLTLAEVCTRYARSTAQTYLVEVCDESKDRYRFGFNGQEKVNEIAGVGNHNTAEFWEYDTRLGRRWNLDPVVKEWESPYLVFNGNPILKADRRGDDADNVNVTATLGNNDELKVKAERITGQTTTESKDANGNKVVTTNTYSDIATARISPDPLTATENSGMVKSIMTTVTKTYDKNGTPRISTPISKTLTTKVDQELTTSLNKGVHFLESFRNTKGKQYNRAIIDESSSFNNALKGAEAPWLAAGKPLTSTFIFGMGEISVKKIGDGVIKEIINKNTPIAIPRSVFAGPQHIGPGAYRNEPSQGVKDAQQKLYDVIFGWFID